MNFFLFLFLEHIDLGLRLTVGEDVLQKPFLQSKHGDGHFPEMSPRTEPAPSSYYPALAGGPGTYIVFVPLSDFSIKLVVDASLNIKKCSIIVN